MAASGFLRRAHESSGSERNTADMAADTISPPQFDTLPEELLIEVLQRLPLEDGGRCECVCKRWFNSISSPYFGRCYNRHRSSFPPRFALFFQRTSTANGAVPVNQSGVHLANDEEAHTIFNSPGFSFSFLPPPFSEPVRLVASSNGLVLCSTFKYFHKLYYVCNPLTMHWVALPPPPTRHNRVRVGFICNQDFDNGMTSLFKVVRIPEFENESQLHTSLKLEIFSSKTGEWTDDSVISWHKPVFGSTPLCNDPVVCNGMLHWRYVNQNHIFAFDPYKQANREFRTIDLPKESCKEASVHLVGESRGRLRYAEFHQGTFGVWELEDQSSGQWCSVHKFHQSEIVWEDPKIAIFTTQCFHLMHILAFHPLEGDFVFLVLPGHIIECNMRSRSLKSLYSLTNRTAELHHRIFPYVLPWWPVQFLKDDGNSLIRQ
ncbi:hypothetical protein C3L33_00130, partial [Rhododendron williamsianum]